MVNIINEQQQANKELLNEIELLKKQLEDKDQELNDYKNTEVTEQEEEAFRQEALSKVEEILVEMRNNFPHCSKNIERDLREMINKPLRQTFMSLCFKYSLYNDYKWNAKENLEKLVNRIIIDHFESSELANEMKKDWNLWKQHSALYRQVEEDGELWGRKAQDIILKDIIEGKDEKIKFLEAEVEQLEERVKIEWEQVDKVLETGEKWSKAQAEDIKEKNKKLKSASEKISYLEARVKKLEQELGQKDKKIEKLGKQLTDSESQNKSLKLLDYLNNKPLPNLPTEEETKQNIFKRLKAKTQVKIQKLQKLIKKEKLHNPEMIAQVEVKSN